jgi:predicted protein tyrosine phosphatase
MIEIAPGLFIGSEADYETTVKHQNGWWVIHACKEQYHRQLLGYRGRGAPKGHPEYLLAERGNRLFLNLVDADDPAFIPKEIIDASLRFIGKALKCGDRVLVHCNQGESRSPSIGLLYLAAYTNALPNASLAEAEAGFRRLYPEYTPKRGMRGFLLIHWNHYVKRDGIDTR